MIRRLVDPFGILNAVHVFVTIFCSRYLMSEEYEVNTATIHCGCGNVWVQSRPTQYGGQGGSPSCCPACKNTGREKVSNF